MALSQQKFREILFQLLFSYDYSDVEEEELVHFMMKQFFVTKKDMRAVLEKRNDILSHIAAIDELIGRYSKSYDFSRISKVEKNILRLAVYELCFGPSLPPKVALAEAIRISRKYATAESSSFVNAILDAIYRNETLLHATEGQHELSIPTTAS